MYSQLRYDYISEDREFFLNNKSQQLYNICVSGVEEITQKMNAVYGKGKLAVVL